jgi:hypothetical protein
MSWLIASASAAYDNVQGTNPDLINTSLYSRLEKYFLRWKEDEQDNSRFKLDKYLLKMCRKDRLIELMKDFVLFDGGQKKTAPRAPVFRHKGRPTACTREEGRHHLAYPRQRQEHRDGDAG